MAILREEIKELKRTLSKCMYALQENEELQKDKERLDWLFKNNATYWVYTREDLDKRMNQSTQ